VTLLIDIGPIPAAHCDDCLEELFKALAENPAAEEAAIWRPHENPWLTRHVEAATARFQAILRAIEGAISKLLLGEAITDLAKAMPPWFRWSDAEFKAAEARLARVAPAGYTLDDWMLVVDYILQQYLPDGVIESEAEYLTVRASMLGKVASAMDSRAEKPNNPSLIDTLVELVPTDFAHVPPKAFSPVEMSIMRVAKARSAENISNVSSVARHRMKTIVVEHVQAGILGQKEGTHQAMRQRLFDSFGQLNRDFRRIAITESGECFNSGFIGAQTVGQKVKRMEAYKGACDFCRSINGKIFTVVDPAAPQKDGATEVWLGKSNVGRSASRRRRVGNALQDRQPAELWWPAAGVQHPNCRGSWTPASDRLAEIAPEFDAWLTALLKRPVAQV
jgi:hypothetical protein